jgi:hypothetical protein
MYWGLGVAHEAILRGGDALRASGCSGSLKFFCAIVKIRLSAFPLPSCRPSPEYAYP